MTECDYCGDEVDGYPHKCKYCGRYHCSKHLLPESHNCEGLEQYKEKNSDRWRKNLSEAISKTKNVFHSKKQITKNFIQKRKNPIRRGYASFNDWLERRGHNKYDYKNRLNYLITTIFFFGASVILFLIFYSNTSKLNEINLWIINLGGLLLLGTIFFVIKFGIRLIKELINIIKRQKNWIKYLIIILIAILLWQSYVNKEAVFNPAFQLYNKINFTLFSPIKLGNFSENNSLSQERTLNSIVQGIVNPKSQIDISKLEQEVHRLINEERINYGLSPLKWDNKIADIAREHSQDMVLRNFFSHDNPDGEDPTDRADRNRYSCVKDYGSYSTYGLAENIALTPIYSSVVGCGSTLTLEKLSICIVDGWMTSPGHRENILTSTYTKTGIGIVYNEDNEAYSTQNFC